MINISMDSQVLTALQTCPRYYENRFIHRLISKGGKSNSLEIGSLAHTILEFYFKAVIQGESYKDAIEIGFAAGNEYIRGYDEANKYILDPHELGMTNTPPDNEKSNKESGEPARIGYNYVLETMEKYFDYYRGDNFTPLNCEHVIGSVIYEDDEMRVLWKAKYDLIGDFIDGIMPVDHKTSKMDVTVNSLNNQFMGQCVLLKTRRVMINKIGFQTTYPIEKRLKRVIVSYSSDRLFEWQNHIVPHYARMLYAYSEAENYPPQFTGCETKYGACMYKSICELDRNLREIEMQTSFDVGKVWDILNEP